MSQLSIIQELVNDLPINAVIPENYYAPSQRKVIMKSLAQAGFLTRSEFPGGRHKTVVYTKVQNIPPMSWAELQKLAKSNLMP